MNKTVLLILALIVVACTPQVTVTSEVTVTLAPPTQTPIPTPTLHPEFMAWQELIASSARYILTADGLIQDNGVVINGLQVDSNGIMTLTVNDEKIILNTSDIIFAEDGIKIEGYEFQNGEWVEAEPPAMSMVMDVLTQYSVDPESYTIVEGEDGLVQVVDNETEAILMESDGEQIKYNIAFASDVIAANSCEPTEYKPTRTGLLPAETTGFYEEYVRPLLLEFGDLGPKLNGSKLFFISPNVEDQCWEVVMTILGKETNLFFRDTNKVPHKLPLIPMTPEEVEEYMLNR